MKDFLENVVFVVVKVLVIIFRGFGSTAVVLLGLFVLYVLIVYAPVSMLTEDECLSKGYPNYRVSYDLDRYCMNLEGSVTIKVEELD